MINEILRSILNEQNASSYEIQSIFVTESQKIKEDEFVIIKTKSFYNYTLRTFADYFESVKDYREHLVCESFIEITGTPILSAYKVTIKERKKGNIKTKTDKNGNIFDITIEQN